MRTERELGTVARKLGRAMTVRDLREMLEGMDDDAAVVFQADYGDYVHTQQALLVTEAEEAEAADVIYVSEGYSHSGLAIRDNTKDEDEDSDAAEIALDGEELTAEEQAEKARFEKAKEDLPRVVILR